MQLHPHTAIEHQGYSRAKSPAQYDYGRPKEAFMGTLPEIDWDKLAFFPEITRILKDNPYAYPVIVYPPGAPGNHQGMWMITPSLDMMTTQYVKLYTSIVAIMAFVPCEAATATEIGHPWFSMGDGAYLKKLDIPHSVVQRIWSHVVREGAKADARTMRISMNKIMLTCGFHQRQTGNATTEFVFDPSLFQSNAPKTTRGGRKSSANQKTPIRPPIPVQLSHALALFECFKAAPTSSLEILATSLPPYFNSRTARVTLDNMQTHANKNFAHFMPAQDCPVLADAGVSSFGGGALKGPVGLWGKGAPLRRVLGVRRRGLR